MESPGFITFTTIKPILTAITVVIIYVAIVAPPICESFEISFKSEIPFTRDASINGIAINFNELIKIVPKGFIQSDIKSFPKSKFDIIRPKTTPSAIPINIFQCNARFFIKFKRLIIQSYFLVLLFKTTT